MPATTKPMLAAVVAGFAALSMPARVDAQPASDAAQAITYADLADLADSASVTLKAKIRKTARVDKDRAANLAPGHVRYYVQARTVSLIGGTAPVGGDLSYLADVPLDWRGKPPRLKNATVLLFARPVAQRPGELQLVAPDAQIAWSQQSETTLREILYELVAPDAPGPVTGVREAIHVPGTLRGEGETQIFLSTRDGSAASLSITHVPGQAPQWGASFSEVTAEVGNPPAPETLAWYRLACFLPRQLPAGANRSDTPESKAQAEADYRLVLDGLGECPRQRG